MKFWILLLVFDLYIHPSKSTKCITRGRFPDNSHHDCRGYTMCLTADTSYDLLCPEHSIYSHFENQCTNVTSYQCLPEYNCTGAGNYINSENCKSYISCIRDLNNITTARLITCPTNELFSVTDGVCVNTPQCNPLIESPKAFEVHINDIKVISGNASFNNLHTSTMYFVNLMCIIAVRIL